jgi:aspartyl-tRNA(Asn)/glutamyl-tRNA(Gln) amidotransferase subunit A
MIRPENAIPWEPVEEIAKQVKDGQVSAIDLVNKSLETIDKFKDYNSIITIGSKQALARAKDIDSGKIKDGRLLGVPYIAKDNYLSLGIETTAGSNILKGYIPPYSATVIKRLEDEGAILVAKANLDAFAHGSSTENSDFGPTLNPFDISRVPGGSSGGSAAAAALGLAPFSLGSDTGGSIRLPASYCGVVGLKPTYGLVSRYGVVAMASSTDCMGPLTTSVRDAALVLDIMAGQDGQDSTMIDRKDSYELKQTRLKGLKIGVVKEYMDDGTSSDIKSAVSSAIKLAENAGAEVSLVSLPSVESALAVYYIIVPAEVSSNLSRYDGVRFGLSNQAATSLDELYEVTRSQGFNAENKRRIMMGTYVLSSGYYDAYYKKAQTVRTKIINEFDDVFKNVDILLGPTAPNTAFKLGSNTKDPLKMYLTDIMTVVANLTGMPAISLPCGLDASGLPIGLQLMAQRGQDSQLLAVASGFEEALNA